MSKYVIDEHQAIEMMKQHSSMNYDGYFNIAFGSKNGYSVQLGFHGGCGPVATDKDLVRAILAVLSESTGLSLTPKLKAKAENA